MFLKITASSFDHAPVSRTISPGASIVDTVSKERRSEIMSRIRATDTKPEMAIRRLVYGMGYRYRLHSRKLPGKPDLVFASRGKVIFVHGCFWHRHDGCSRCRTPRSRVKFWIDKFAANVQNDRKVQEELTVLGWKSLVVWECQVKDTESMVERIVGFLEE